MWRGGVNGSLVGEKEHGQRLQGTNKWKLVLMGRRVFYVLGVLGMN